MDPTNIYDISNLSGGKNIKLNNQKGYNLSGISLACFFIIVIIIVLIALGVITYYLLFTNSTVSTTETLKPYIPYLINTTNVPLSAQKCVYGTTYGFNDAGDFY